MAVEWARIIRTQKELKRDKKRSGQETITTKVVYRVRVDDAANTSIVEVEEAVPVQLGDVFEGVADCICIGKNAAVETDSGLSYLVTLDYSTEREGDLNAQTPDNRELSIDEEAVSVPIFIAQAPPNILYSDGTDPEGSTLSDWKWKHVVCNSAGQRFDPSVEEELIDTVYTFSRDEHTFDNNVAKQYRNTINDSDFHISYQNVTYTITKHCGLLRSWTAKAVFGKEGVIDHWRHTYVIVERGDTWLKRVLDDGLAEIKDTDNPTKKKPLRDDNSDPLTHPVHLDGHGKRLTGTSPQPVLLVFRTKKEANWGNLAIT